MANYENLKYGITNAIKENHNNEIYGTLLQQVLLRMVNSLGVGYIYAGVATPTMAPAIQDSKVFYLTATPGTYTNFGGIVVRNGELAVLKYDTQWTKDAFNVGGGGGGSINVIDDLFTESATDALSANMGYRLNLHKAINLRSVTLDAYETYLIVSAGSWYSFDRPLNDSDMYDVYTEILTDFEYAECVIEFFTDTTVPNFTFNDIMWAGGKQPEFQPSKHYIISIVNYFGVCSEF